MNQNETKLSNILVVSSIAIIAFGLLPSGTYAITRVVIFGTLTVLFLFANHAVKRGHQTRQMATQKGNSRTYNLDEVSRSNGDDPTYESRRQSAHVTRLPNVLGGPIPNGQRPTQKPPRARGPRKPKNLREREAMLITKILGQTFGMKDTGVKWWEPSHIKMTPEFIGYVITEPGIQFKKLSAIEGDLARKIKELSRPDHRGNLKATFVDSQPIVLQVQSPKPYKLDWEKRITQTTPWSAMIAMSWAGIEESPLIINIAPGKHRIEQAKQGISDKIDYLNGAIYGAPGGGKSHIMHMMLVGLMESTSPDKLHIYGIDTNDNVFAKKYMSCPHFKGFASTFEQAEGILDKFEYWCTPEGEQSDRDDVIRLLVIDEAAKTFQDADYGEAIVDAYRKIMSEGRKGGIRTLAVVQNPDARCFPPDLKALLSWQMSTRIMNDSYIVSQLKMRGARNLNGEGELVMTSDAGDARIKSFWMEDSDHRGAVNGIVAKWGLSSRKSQPSPALVAQEAPVYQEPEQEQAAPSFTRQTTVDDRQEDGAPLGVIAPRPHEGSPTLSDPQTAIDGELKTPIGNRSIYPGELDGLCTLAKKSFSSKKTGLVNLTELCEHVYGRTKNKKTFKWLREALESADLEAHGLRIKKFVQ